MESYEVAKTTFAKFYIHSSDLFQRILNSLIYLKILHWITLRRNEMLKHFHFQSSSIMLFALFLVGCSSTSETRPDLAEYSFLDSTKSFLELNSTRNNGAVVDKGNFYPKSAYSFSYRYCANSSQQAKNDVAEYLDLAKRTCDANIGTLVHQETASWCVYNANTVEERPIFSARISSTELWADLCLDGPFVTLRVIENTNAPSNEWLSAAQVLGYQPYSIHRTLISDSNDLGSAAYTSQPNVTVQPQVWTEESQFIYTNKGQTVCLFEQPKGSSLGHTYQGAVMQAYKGRVKVLATAKFKGDIRIAPALEKVDWYSEAYIDAAANSWFVCG